MERASFAAGCFWGVEHAFKQLPGVIETEVGYQGGGSSAPTYEEVCRKDTGHAEAVLVKFDPNILSYDRLLDAFFFMHNPTEFNRQGPDVGPQYRSAIFPMSYEQKTTAIAKIEKMKDKYTLPVVTTIEEDCPFHSAEELHQNYLQNNPNGYCHIGFDIFSKLKQGLF